MFKQNKKRSREFKNSNQVIDLDQAREERRKRRKELAAQKQNKGNKASAEELSGRKINKRNRKRLIYSCVILGIMVVIGVSVFHVYLLEKEYTEIVAQKKELQGEKKELTEELGNINNPEYVEQQARQQLKMVKPGEVLYILPEEKVTKGAVVPEDGSTLMPAGEASD